MRIIAGKFRGHPLATLGKGDDKARLRPTSDRVRESLFSMLEGGRFGSPVEGARVLDLFAGTGGLGFEALSRGASHVTFVENGRTGARLIAENRRKLGVDGETALIRADACRLPANAGEPFDLVFLDPPYGQKLGEKALAGFGWIAPGALVIWEENAPQDAPEGYAERDTRRYGDTHITILEALS
jgi:16S rRNA (guanine966-N2)-methyltransferase